MADAPSGGGGISGGEIIVLVVLALGALAVLSGNPIKVQNNTTPSTPAPVVQQCVITLTRPSTKELISTVVTVVGSITPCSNTPALATVVYAQVVDSSGALMSTYTPIPVTATDTTRGTFAANIAITGAPAAGTGYIIITGPNKADGTATSSRVAIHFSH